MGLTYEVAGHLLVLLEPAGVAELQQGIHVIGAGLQQDLRGGGKLPGLRAGPAGSHVGGARPQASLFLRHLNLGENTARGGEAQSLT